MGKPRANLFWLLRVFLVPLAVLALLSAKASATPAEAFSIGKPPLKITVLTGPRNDFCYSDHIEAIEKLVETERDRINKAGGIAGRKIEIQVRDDGGIRSEPLQMCVRPSPIRRRLR